MYVCMYTWAGWDTERLQYSLCYIICHTEQNNRRRGVELIRGRKIQVLNYLYSSDTFPLYLHLLYLREYLYLVPRCTAVTVSQSNPFQ